MVDRVCNHGPLLTRLEFRIFFFVTLSLLQSGQLPPECLSKEAVAQDSERWVRKHLRAKNGGFVTWAKGM